MAFKPFCSDCFLTVGDLNFSCAKCDKLIAIGEKLRKQQETIKDMSLIATAQIMENYYARKKARLGGYDGTD